MTLLSNGKVNNDFPMIYTEGSVVFKNIGRKALKKTSHSIFTATAMHCTLLQFISYKTLLSLLSLQYKALALPRKSFQTMQN
jgi:hypothetical protein